MPSKSTVRSRWALRLAGLFAILATGLALSPQLWSFADKGELPPELAIVPPDAFAFIHLRAADVWDHEMAAKIRGLLEERKQDFVRDLPISLSSVESVSLVFLTAQSAMVPLAAPKPKEAPAKTIRGDEFDFDKDKRKFDDKKKKLDDDDEPKLKEDSPKAKKMDFVFYQFRVDRKDKDVASIRIQNGVITEVTIKPADKGLKAEKKSDVDVEVTVTNAKLASGWYKVTIKGKSIDGTSATLESGVFAGSEEEFENARDPKKRKSRDDDEPRKDDDKKKSVESSFRTEDKENNSDFNVAIKGQDEDAAATVRVNGQEGGKKQPDDAKVEKKAASKYQALIVGVWDWKVGGATLVVIVNKNGTGSLEGPAGKKTFTWRIQGDNNNNFVFNMDGKDSGFLIDSASANKIEGNDPAAPGQKIIWTRKDKTPADNTKVDKKAPDSQYQDKVVGVWDWKVGGGALVVTINKDGTGLMEGPMVKKTITWRIQRGNNFVFNLDGKDSGFLIDKASENTIEGTDPEAPGQKIIWTRKGKTPQDDKTQADNTKDAKVDKKAPDSKYQDKVVGVWDWKVGGGALVVTINKDGTGLMEGPAVKKTITWRIQRGNNFVFNLDGKDSGFLIDKASENTIEGTDPEAPGQKIIWTRKGKGAKDKSPEKKTSQGGNDQEILFTSQDKVFEDKFPEKKGPPRDDNFGPQFLLIVKMKAPYDRAKVLELARAKNGKEETYKGKTYLVHPFGPVVWFMNETTFVIASSETSMKAALDQPEQARPAGAQAAALDLAAKKHQLVVGFNLNEPTALIIKKQIAQELARARPGDEPFPGFVMAPLLETQSAVLSVDLLKESKVKVQAVLSFTGAEKAAAAATALQDSIALGRILLLGKLVQELKVEAAFAEEHRNEIFFLLQAAGQAEAALRGSTVERRQSLVTFQAEGQFDIDYLRGKAKIAADSLRLDPAALMARKRQESINNLKQMMLAMHSYHDVYKKLPAHAMYNFADETNKPLLSWRVAILPFIEQVPLYNQFHHDEPWDSEHNIKLLAMMPKIYAPLKGVRTKEPYTTFYQVVVGPGTAFEIARDAPRLSGLTFGRIPDGLSNTIGIVEAADPVPWTKPDDLVFDPKGPLPKMGGTLFPDGFCCAMLDGSVRFIKPARPGVTPEEAARRGEVSQETLRNAITCADGIPLGPDW